MTYIKIWTDFRETISRLSDAEKGRLLDAMLLYAETGSEPEEMDGNESFLWPVVKQGIDRLESASARNRMNGRKGGRPAAGAKRKAPDAAGNSRIEASETGYNRNEPNESENNPAKPEQSLKEKKIKEKEKKEMKKETPPTGDKEKALPRFSPPSPEEVREYCLARGYRVNPEQFHDYYTANGWRVGRFVMKDWRAAVRTWAARETKQPAPFTPGDIRAYPQRDYSGEHEKAMQQMREMIRQSKRESGEILPGPEKTEPDMTRPVRRVESA